MSLLSNAIAIPTASTGYNLTDSVRFRSSASAYLSRTFTSTGNTRKMTISLWAKRGKLDTTQLLFAGGTADATSTRGNSMYFYTSASGTAPYKLGFGWYGIGTNRSNYEFRDPAAWYHIVLAIDTTQATAANRTRLYVNGVESGFDTQHITQNADLGLNSATTHYINNTTGGGSTTSEGYLTEVNFVDGQALTPSDFGETDSTTGVWKPKKYTGSYGTNGFYLPMKATTQASGFNTVTYAGTGSSGTKITDVGFQPDLVWIKGRNVVNGHGLYDSVRGAGKRLLSHLANAEDTVTGVSSFDSNGFSLSSTYNTSSETYVAWCWEAGGTASSNTNGTITSSVSANTAKGFSVVTYTGNGTTATIGHGLGSTPDMIIVKRRNAVDSWFCYHSALTTDNYIRLNSTNGVQSLSGYWGTPSSTTFGAAYGGTNTNGGTFVAYCFSEVAGFSKFGSYTGNGSTSGPTITTGFRPAFVMVKRTDANADWVMFDNTRDPDNIADTYLMANTTGAEGTANYCNFTNTGFDITTTSTFGNASGGSYIYMAFADTRDFQWNFDASGNKNNWTPVNINSNASSETTYDIMSDVPTLTDEDSSNFAVLNPLSSTVATKPLEGNLYFNNDPSSNATYVSTIGVSTGKWYWEYKASSQYIMMGVTKTDFMALNSALTAGTYSYTTYNGNKYNNGTNNGAYMSVAANDIVGVALDLDAGTIVMYKNGVSQGTMYSGLSGTFFPHIGCPNALSAGYINFGQRPFAYTPPTGYKKLNTYNLPDSAIKDGSKYFDVDAWSGTTSAQYDTQSRSSLSFSPDLVWIKSRSDAVDHTLVDSVTGAGKYLSSNTTTAQTTDATGYASVYSFDTNGWTMEYNGRTSMTGRTYVGWAWKGSDSTAVSNTDGSITSTVSANTTSGFSIITYTGTGSAGSVGHGLSVAPEIWIGKNRTTAFNWLVHTTIIDGSLDYLWLNLTDAKGDQGAGWNADSTKINLASVSTAINTSGNNHVIYAFHSVEGFSKFGTYIGNGSTDGPFIYTGFRPAFLLMKRTDSSTAGFWVLHDSTRDDYNPADKELFPNSTTAEYEVSTREIDLLSNGFKFRDLEYSNYSGAQYVYMAFAENPFKNSLAR